MKKRSEIEKYEAKLERYERKAWKKSRKIVKRYSIKILKWIFFGADFDTSEKTMETLLHIFDIVAIVYVCCRLSSI